MAINTQNIINIVLMAKDRASKVVNRATQHIRKDVDQVSAAMKKNEFRFQGWAMSIMFFGMAVQRAMLTVWKSSTKTFQEIAHSIEGSTTAFDQLEGSMKFLQFVVGDALQPLAQALIPIIERVAEWVMANEGATRSMVKWGVILGSTLMYLGMLVLGMGGLITAVKNFWVVGKAAFVFVGTWIIRLLQMVPLLGKYVTVLKHVWVAMATAVKIKLLGIISAIIIVLVYIFKLKNAIGGWGEFFKSVLRGLLRVLVNFGQAIIDNMLTPIQLAVQLLVKAMSALGQKPPSWMTEFAQKGFQVAPQYYDLEEQYLAPQQGYATGFDGLLPQFQQGGVVNINEVNVTNPQDMEMLLQQILAQTGASGGVQ